MAMPYSANFAKDFNNNSDLAENMHALYGVWNAWTSGNVAY